MKNKINFLNEIKLPIFNIQLVNKIIKKYNDITNKNDKLTKSVLLEIRNSISDILFDLLDDDVKKDLNANDMDYLLYRWTLGVINGNKEYDIKCDRCEHINQTKPIFKIKYVDTDFNKIVDIETKHHYPIRYNDTLSNDQIDELNNKMNYMDVKKIINEINHNLEKYLSNVYIESDINIICDECGAKIKKNHKIMDIVFFVLNSII